MTVDRGSGGLGGKLREARERKGFSLSQIANSTKIAVAVLEALERNDVSRLPGGIFGRAFVRSFATEVGLDPETTIQEFIAQFRDESVGAGHRPFEQIEDNESIESNRRMASVFLRLIALSIPVAGVILYFGVARRPAPPSDAALPGAAPAALHAAPSVASAADVPSGRFVVRLTATRSCWVSATVDGEKQIQGLLQPGEQRTLTVRRELALNVGDAGAMTVTINGVETTPLGQAGEVVNLRVNLANFKTYLPVR